MILTWPVWDLSSLNSATASHCKRIIDGLMGKPVLLPASEGVGSRDTVDREGYPGSVVLRGRWAPERFMCPESPARDLK